MKAFVILPPRSKYPRSHEILGRGWVHRRVESALSAMKGKRHTFSPSDIGETIGRLAHPLVSETYHQKIGALRGVTGGTTTPLFDYLETDLEDLGSTSLPSNFRSRLRDDHDCEKAMYEMHIFAGFVRLGHSGSWLPAAKSRRPEFTITAKALGSFSVECKKRDKMDGYQKDADRFWKHLQYQLGERMRELSLNYWVRVSSRQFHLAEVDPLVSEIVSVIPGQEHGQFDSSTGLYHIDFQRLAEPGESIPREVVDLFPRGQFGDNIGKSRRDQLLTGPLQDPKLIRMEAVDDPEHRVSSLLSRLKDAAKQVIKGLPAIVYLDVNLPRYERELPEFDGLTQAVTERLVAMHSNVSAVVLTNIYPGLTLDGKLGWRVRTQLITHPRPEAPLPKRLRFPGDELGTRWIPGSWAHGA